MAQTSDTYHEPYELLSEESRNMHRALVSLQEELEAIDWYQQRIDATTDEELAAILAHNRDEEIEHAMMVLEWIRRRNATLAAEVRRNLLAEGSSRAAEEGTGGGSPEPAPPTDGSLGIGSLRAATTA